MYTILNRCPSLTLFALLWTFLLHCKTFLEPDRMHDHMKFLFYEYQYQCHHLRILMQGRFLNSLLSLSLASTYLLFIQEKYSCILRFLNQKLAFRKNLSIEISIVHQKLLQEKSCCLFLVIIWYLIQVLNKLPSNRFEQYLEWASLVSL